MELHGTLFSVNYQIYQGLSIHFDGNSDKCDFFFKQRRKISGFMEYSRYFHEPKPSQATLEEQLEEHRQGAAVQPYPVIT